MKKIFGLSLILVISLTLYGCGCSKKKEKEIITTCSSKSIQKASGYEIETTHKIYSKENIVNKVESKTIITSKKEKILKNFESDFKKQYERNKKTYGEYDYTIDIKEGKLESIVTIDYSKFDMKKFIKDNVAMKEYVNDDNKYTLEGAKKYYKTTGAICK